MDVEGFEYEVINGMTETIKKFYPLIIMEFHCLLLGKEKAKKLLLKLRDFKYVIKNYFSRDLDYPMIGTIKNAEKISIDRLIENLDSNITPENFTIFLTHK